jgi:hypothetical protein
MANREGRWYNQRGEMVARLNRKDGDTYMPSVTTVLGQISNPGLDVWKRKQALMAALTLTRADMETDGEVIDRILEDSEQHAATAATFGKEVHAAIESYLTDQSITIIDPRTAVVMDSVREWIKAVELKGVSEQRAVNMEYGFGGCADLIGTCNLAFGDCLVDYKTQAVKSTKKKGEPRPAFYESWIYQLGAYQILFGRLDLVPISVVISTDEKTLGQVFVKVWTPEEAANGREVFMHALKLFKSIKKLED